MALTGILSQLLQVAIAQVLAVQEVVDTLAPFVQTLPQLPQLLLSVLSTKH